MSAAAEATGTFPSVRTYVLLCHSVTMERAATLLAGSPIGKDMKEAQQAVAA